MGNKAKSSETCSWIQITGHIDCFVPFEDNQKVAKAMKSRDRSEYHNYLSIDEKDTIFPFLPQFHGLLEEKVKIRINHAELSNSDEWFVLSNVLTGFRDPVVMDVKMGRSNCNMRQYNVMSAKRKDLYKKIIDLDFPIDLLTGEEKREEAVTKLRYVELRDTMSTTAQFGFRIDAMNISKSKEF